MHDRWSAAFVKALLGIVVWSTAAATASSPLSAGTEITRPIGPSSRSHVARRALLTHHRVFRLPQSFAATNTWVIHDLTALVPTCPPAFSLGLRARSQFACRFRSENPPAVTANAINQHGDVALAVCQAACIASVFDASHAMLVPLAPLVPPPPPRRGPVPQSNPSAGDLYVPYALNDRGQLVGYYYNKALNLQRPVVWTRQGPLGSTIAYLDRSPADQGAAYAVNNHGVAVGSVLLDQQGALGAVRFTTGAPVPLTPTPTNSDVYGINDAGVAVGDVVGFATVYINDAPAIIPTRDQCPPPYDLCDQNAAVAINATGLVVGNYITNYFDMPTQSLTAFSYDIAGGGFTTLVPGCFDADCPIMGYQAGDSDSVVALNDGGDYVGYFDGTPWASFAPLGDANTLLPPGSGWTITGVAGINDRRQIIGQGTRAGYGSTPRAFLLEPQT